MLKLNEKQWNFYKVGDLFSIEKCKCSKAGDLVEGNIPYVGATNRNNGTMSFSSNSKLATKGNCIAFICDGQGSVGYSIYKYENFIGSTTLKSGRNEKLNKLNGLFFTTCLDMNKTIYDYGYKRNEPRLKNETIALPTKANNKPDYEYMEQYTKSVIDQKLEKYVDYAKSIINDLKTKEIEKLEDKEWKEFSIEELFDIKIGKNIDGNKINKTNGDIPYVTRKENNNGLDGFIDYDLSLLNKEFPVITIGNETATPFVQTSYKFFTGTKVNIMKLKDFESKEVLFFISQCIKQQKSKYSYSITINSTRLKKQKILLPINEEGKPDYEYMEQYIKNLMNKKVNQYLNYLQKTQSK